MTTSQHRLAIRVTNRVAESMRNSAPPRAIWPTDNWDECSRLIRQISLATSRGWILAAVRLWSRLPTALQALQLRLAQCVSSYELASATPSFRSIYEEILALEAEFGGFTVDFQAETLSVQTEPIELEDILLGEFEIRLNWLRIAEPSPFRIVAVNANPAASNSDVTHPHVQVETLCEGEGRAAIQAALASGRLCDFFTIVAQILRTYNAGSAYITLAEWGGETCEDCGELVQSGDLSSCNRCDRLLCGECDVRCADCGNGYCDGCLDRCRDCEQPLCANCQYECESCQEAFCESCLDGLICDSCQTVSETEVTHETISKT